MSLIEQLNCTIIFNHGRLIVINQPYVIGIRINDKLLPRYGISRLTFVNRLPGLCLRIENTQKENK
jgi:hypothetical protein